MSQVFLRVIAVKDMEVQFAEDAMVSGWLTYNGTNVDHFRPKENQLKGRLCDDYPYEETDVFDMFDVQRLDAVIQASMLMLNGYGAWMLETYEGKNSKDAECTHAAFPVPFNNYGSDEVQHELSECVCRILDSEKEFATIVLAPLCEAENVNDGVRIFITQPFIMWQPEETIPDLPAVGSKFQY